MWASQPWNPVSLREIGPCFDSIKSEWGNVSGARTLIPEMNPAPDAPEGFRVLWIEDDLKYVELLKLELGTRFRFEVVGALSPELAGNLSADSPFHAVIIDMHLAQGRQGPQDFQRIRQLGYSGPIFVLSNDESVVSKIEMLALGVDDYLWKVMPTEELELRLRNSIQRYRDRSTNQPLSRGGSATPESAGGSAHQVALEGLSIHLDRLTASLFDQSLEFSKLELKIMLTLLRHHPQATAVETLRKEVWENTAVENGTLSTFFWKMNKKTKDWAYRIVRSGDEVLLKRLSASHP